MIFSILRFYLQVLRHKRYVFLEGQRFGVSFWQLLIHDWDKFLPSRTLPYTRYWIQGDRSEAAREAFQHAFRQHWGTNPHHWEYWIRVFPDKSVLVEEIPPKYFKEMIADWCAASRTHGNVSVFDWYRHNRHNILLAPRTQYWADHYMMRSTHCTLVVDDADDG